MKKIMDKKIITVIAAALCLTACYDDYVGDYDVIACGFANQTDVRTVVVGEGMSFSTGVALGGTIDNGKDRYITIGTDYSLVGESTYNALKNHTFEYISSLMKSVPSIWALPGDVYTVQFEGNRAGQALIRKGSHLGVITIKVDSAKFLSDTDRLLPKDVIPLTIVDGNGTAVIEGKESSVIAVRYENMLFGNWYHGGSADVYDDAGNLLRSENYEISIPQADNQVWTLTTVEPFALTANAYGPGFTTNSAQMKLTLGADDSITISSVPGATVVVEQDGECYFKRTKLLQDREIVLNYKYISGTETYHAHDVLRFRNRIRDGVNEWQDENQSHYE